MKTLVAKSKNIMVKKKATVIVSYLMSPKLDECGKPTESTFSRS